MLNQPKLLMVVAWLALVAQSSTCVGQKSETEVVDETGKVFGGLAELTLARDHVMKRCAMIATGESHNTSEDGVPKTGPRYDFQLYDAATSFKYKGHAYLYADGTSPLFGREFWQEMVRCNGLLKVRSGFINAVVKPYTVKPPEVGELEFLQSESFFPFKFSPFDNIMMITDHMFFYAMPDGYQFETIFLREAKFVSSRFLIGQNVESVWHLQKADMNFDIYVVHSATCDYLPIEVKYRPHLKIGHQTFSDMRVDWVKQNDAWVPSRLQAGSTRFRKNGKDLPYQYLLSFKWKVGDEAVDELFQCDSDDYRIPIMEQFGVVFSHVRNGVSIPGQYERPENLEFTTPSLINR